MDLSDALLNTCRSSEEERARAFLKGGGCSALFERFVALGR